MAEREGTYEYECMRAELLGLPRPSRQEFEESQKLKENVENEEQELEKMKVKKIISNQYQTNCNYIYIIFAMIHLQEIDLNDEQITDTQGKVDELNSILSNTQQKINKLKCACGSLTSYFKFRSLGGSTSNSTNQSPAHQSQSVDGGNSINDALDTLDEMKNVNEESKISFMKQSSIDVKNKVTSQLDKLDSLLRKSENAEIAMQKQNNDMKQMLK